MARANSVIPSLSMMIEKESPPKSQVWHRNICSAVFTLALAEWSSWKGHFMACHRSPSGTWSAP